MPPPPLLLLLLFVAVLPSFAPATAQFPCIDSHGGNFSRLEFLRRAAMLRKASLQATQTGVQLPVRWSSAGYLVDLAIGTPPLVFSAMLDTGSDLVWTQCFSQPSESLTYAALPCTSPQCQTLPRFSCSPDCHYSYSYGDTSYTKGVLGTETFTFGAADPAAITGIAFGCSTVSEVGAENSPFFSNSAGILGMARGPLSLVSQLGEERFSYCFASDDTTTALLFGSSANPSPQASSTPFVNVPSPLYYLSLQGISVGATLLPIPNTTLALQSNGTGGLVIDSGTTFTLLTDPAHAMLKQALVSQIDLPVATVAGYDLCFSLPPDASGVALPILVFHLDGADMAFPAANYFVVNSSAGLLCLAIFGSPFNLSILGNFQQQNMHLVYDLAGGKLSFEPANCSDRSLVDVVTKK
ncbi:unnamed protein product [Musa acuminata subsp. malaccensis]|uniref:(wild Malaysian banana) hypothetical protein n=1 Tax=Musa acuminata subsp. malaccensis TaxID=214687 RepID=A0A804KUP5_MUSAM|nr:PREDICTED: aspartic proteinase nepenthesin-1-like [Musa acuminata subsp. malaccensis]CAG1853115.1 unnamed protein product [Musa acuminata subsp. malaccensis]